MLIFIIIKMSIITSFHISYNMTAQIREYSIVQGNKKGAAFCNSAPIMLDLLHGTPFGSTSVTFTGARIVCSRWCISCFVSSTNTYNHSHKFVATMCIKPNLCISLKVPDSMSLLVRNMNCICANVRAIRKAGVITDSTDRHLSVISKYSPNSKPLYTIEPIPNAENNKGLKSSWNWKENKTVNRKWLQFTDSAKPQIKTAVARNVLFYFWSLSRCNFSVSILFQSVLYKN